MSDEQFEKIVREFQCVSTSNKSNKNIKQLCVNVLSINSKRGLYCLAYRKLNLDVENKAFIPEDNVTICKEFTIDGEKQSVRMFLDADDCSLLDDFDNNRELIKDRITETNKFIGNIYVDDMPYVMAVEINIMVDLQFEYSAIIDMYESGQVTAPIQAFFGNLLERPARGKDYSIALLNKKVNLDQLLAINYAMSYPLAYIQGPPGTGKTNTIENTISTAFFNEKTILFSSYNNHPIDTVFNSLSSLKYKNNTIPFPIIRLGNNDKVAEAIEYIKNLYERVKKITVFAGTLKKNKGEKIRRTRQLNSLLKKHEEMLDLKERKEAIQKLLDSTNDLTFMSDLKARQLNDVEKRIQSIKEITDADALSLLSDDFEEYYKYLYYTSAKYIKRLDEDQYEGLREILSLSDKEKQVVEFNRYLADEENFAKFLQIFPIVVTTCISAHKLGSPRQYFDMVILDEASQCNTAISLVPIIRGNNLMLVGDPQQLNPVILLDSTKNIILRDKYSVGSEYDYINNSIYKTYIACDAVSDEVLLSYHYRCHRRIIEFNNQKYYNGKLQIKSESNEVNPLIYVDVGEGKTDYKNTAPEECEQIIKFIQSNPNKSIGIITPFVNQKNLINAELKQWGIENVSCGTVHAFQGDEKDIILFSLALTDQTQKKTYEWLKGNKELINVAVSRAKNQLILLTNTQNLERLHSGSDDDDIYELAQYIKSKGTTRVTSKLVNSRAFGIKPYSTETEDAFLRNLNHALGNIRAGHRQYEIVTQAALSQIFSETFSNSNMYYTGRFDFAVLNKRTREPLFAIELDGKEHHEEAKVKARDAQKQQICDEHGFQLIRVENSYARRYAYIKNILQEYFSKV